MSRFHIRCSKEACRARQMVRVEPLNFKCRKCGHGKFRKVNGGDRGKQTQCMCAGYKWEGRNGRNHNARHRMGSKACWFRPDGTQRMPGDADYNYESEEEREWYESQGKS